MLKHLLLAFALASNGFISGIAQAAELDLSQHKGKVVYVDLWASWCPPCRASFPWMEQLHQDLKDEGLVILAVNTGDEPADAERFLAMTNPSFEIITDPDGDIAANLNAMGMPFSVLYDREGNLVSSHVGFSNKDAPELRRVIESLLAEKI